MNRNSLPAPPLLSTAISQDWLTRPSRAVWLLPPVFLWETTKTSQALRLQPRASAINSTMSCPKPFKSSWSSTKPAKMWESSPPIQLQHWFMAPTLPSESCSGFSLLSSGTLESKSPWQSRPQCLSQRTTWNMGKNTSNQEHLEFLSRFSPSVIWNP